MIRPGHEPAADRPPENQELGGALAALGGWAVSVAILAFVGIESMTQALPSEVAMHARVTAYLSVFATAGVTASMGVLFALAAAGMLWWVEKPLPPRDVVVAVANAYWALAGYSVAMAVLILASPTPAPELSELLESEDLMPLLLGDGVGLATPTLLGAVSLSAGCLAIWWRLSLDAGRWMALLGVAAGVSVVGCAMAILSRLTAMFEL